MIDVPMSAEERDNARNALLLTLMRLGPDGLPGLERTLQSSDATLRRWTVNSLDFVGRPALDLLINHLGEPNVEVRIALMGVLLRTRGALDKLREMVADSTLEMQTRVSAAWVLEGFGRDAAPAVPELTATLVSNRGPEGLSLRGNVVRVLGRLGPDAVPAIDALGATLNDEFAPTRDEAANVLMHIGPRAVPALLTALRDKNCRGRDLAATALAVQSTLDRAAVETLAASLSDPDEKVRKAVDSALKKSGAKSARPSVS